MVIGVFPAAKLGVLAIKQISKPIANVIKTNAKNSPVFRKYVCMPPAQFYNWMEVKTKMWALNLGRPVNVPPLNEAAAIELGANLLGEIIIFTIGAGLLIFEYARQSKNESKKQETARIEKAELATTLSEMGFRLERQDAQLREMTRVLADLESHSIFRWTKDRLLEYQPFDPNNPDQTPVGIRRDSIYDPNKSLLFKALHALETRLFAFGRGSESDTKSLNIQPPIHNLLPEEEIDVQPYVNNNDPLNVSKVAAVPMVADK